MSLPENRVTRTTVIYENLFKRIKQKDVPSPLVKMC